MCLAQEPQARESTAPRGLQLLIASPRGVQPLISMGPLTRLLPLGPMRPQIHLLSLRSFARGHPRQSQAPGEVSRGSLSCTPQSLVSSLSVARLRGPLGDLSTPLCSPRDTERRPSFSCSPSSLLIVPSFGPHPRAPHSLHWAPSSSQSPGSSLLLGSPETRTLRDRQFLGAGDASWGQESSPCL